MTDIKIANQASLLNINEVAKKIDIDANELELFGTSKAKVSLKKEREKRDSNLILVTATNPNKAGSGKSTTTIGLHDALCSLNKKSIACLREPSLGPVFGVKGGATGGGYAQVIPMEDINLHFTGDMHAITAANNLICACIDNHIHQGNKLQIDINRIIFKRCLDINDRSLREITIGQGSHVNGVERKDGFNITVASEIMAILCLAKDLEDLEEKIKKIIIAFNTEGNFVYVEDLDMSGSVAILMKDAIKPNLVQTIENNPVLIHGGPFANIAHGCNSLIATKMACNLSDYVVTESGFGADLGSEKFIDIKTRMGDLKPKVVVIVANMQALKLNGGQSDEDLFAPNMETVKKGINNLEKHIDTVKNYNVKYIVAINNYSKDIKEEKDYVINWCQENNHPVSLNDTWAKGSEGGIDLAKQVIELCEVNESSHQYIYELEDEFEEKITKVVQKVYGGKGFDLTPEAKLDLELLRNNNLDKLPICIAKTQMSLSDDPKKLGRPEGFDIVIKSIIPATGAGFLIVITQNILTMPGLPKIPAANNMSIENEEIKGLF